MKTDQLGAEVLAQLLHCDYLPSVWVSDATTNGQLTGEAKAEKSIAAPGNTIIDTHFAYFAKCVLPQQKDHRMLGLSHHRISAVVISNSHTEPLPESDNTQHEISGNPPLIRSRVLSESVRDVFRRTLDARSQNGRPN